MYTYKAQVLNVVDGDTIDVIIDLGFKLTMQQRLRLARVDTPERGREGYDEAKSFVQSMVGNKLVTVQTKKVSKWGYYLAEVHDDLGKNLSDELLKKELARPYSGGEK